jgi:hypothetical protein
MIDLKTKPIKDFLDAVDEVLNSNTFLLELHIPARVGIKTALDSFIRSEEFRNQFFLNDAEREWHNFHASKFNTELKKREYWPRPGRLTLDNFSLDVSIPEAGKTEYLIAMLTADHSIGHFFSPYSHQKERKQAEEITNAFVGCIANVENWELMVVSPTFLYDGYNHRTEKNVICYFGDGAGCASDTATLIVSGEKGFLILTNGFD